VSSHIRVNIKLESAPVSTWVIISLRSTALCERNSTRCDCWGLTEPLSFDRDMDTRNASFSTSGHGGGVPQRPAHSVWIHKNGSIKTNKEDTTSLSSRASTPRTGSHDFQALLRRDSFLETFDPSLLENRSGSFHSLFDLALGYTDENGGLDESAGGSSSERSHQVMRRMRYLTCVAAIGGFLSGYNTGVISGALLPLTRVFGMSPFQEESIVSVEKWLSWCLVPSNLTD